MYGILVAAVWLSWYSGRSDTRGPRFEYSHWQKIYIEHVFIVNCIEKTKINKKDAGNGPFFLKKTCME